MSLFSSLVSATDSLIAYDRSMSVIQNNVSNADVPGYARQRLTFTPRLFDPNQGLSGGVEAGALVSSRDRYSERNVWRQNQLLGAASQQTADLEQIEVAFPVASGAGVAGAINRFFSAVSSWTVNPNDPVSRQVVLDRADGLARAFNENAEAIGDVKFSIDHQIRSTVDNINDLADRIRDLNIERRSDRRKVNDPSIDAQMHGALEELARLTDFNALYQEDGSITVLLGGQTPIVLGDQSHHLAADFSTVQPTINNDQDQDITWQLSGGSLHSLLETRNTLLPSYEADLNHLAEAFAGRVNSVLSGGLDASGSTPSIDLFTFDPLAGAAASLKTNPMAPAQLAAADSTSPGGNGNAFALAQLAESNEIDDVTFTQFFAKLSARVGRDLVRARDAEGLQKQLVAQAQALREERSGVSLDEEAARLVEAQRAYQANARLFQVLNELTDELIGLLR